MESLQARDPYEGAAWDFVWNTPKSNVGDSEETSTSVGRAQA